MDHGLQGLIHHFENQEQRDVETIAALMGSLDEYNHRRGVLLIGDRKGEALRWHLTGLRRTYRTTGALTEDESLALIASERILNDESEIQKYAREVILLAIENR